MSTPLGMAHHQSWLRGSEGSAICQESLYLGSHALWGWICRTFRRKSKERPFYKHAYLVEVLAGSLIGPLGWASTAEMLPNLKPKDLKKRVGLRVDIRKGHQKSSKIRKNFFFFICYFFVYLRASHSFISMIF